MRDEDRIRILHMIDAAEAVWKTATVEIPALVPLLRTLAGMSPQEA
jgi:hypothetical protein